MAILALTALILLVLSAHYFVRGSVMIALVGGGHDLGINGISSDYVDGHWAWFRRRWRQRQLLWWAVPHSNYLNWCSNSNMVSLILFHVFIFSLNILTFHFFADA